jgi:hypothetical protein
MAGVTINAKDTNGNPISLTNVDLSYDLEISTIDSELSWDLITVDNAPSTTITPHVGGRPDDRS